MVSITITHHWEYCPSIEHTLFCQPVSVGRQRIERYTAGCSRWAMGNGSRGLAKLAKPMEWSEFKNLDGRSQWRERMTRREHHLLFMAAAGGSWRGLSF